MRELAPAVVVLACLCATPPAGDRGPPAGAAGVGTGAAPAVARVLVSGEWGPGPGRFGLFREEPPGYGPSCFALDAAGQTYVCDDENARLQVFGPDGRFLRAMPAARRPRLYMEDMCIGRDGSIYATDGRRVCRYAPGGGSFVDLAPQPVPPGAREPPGASRLAVVAGGSEQGPVFYFEQGGRRPDGRGSAFVARYDDQLRYEASVEAYDLVSGPEARLLCAILGPREGGPEPWGREIVVINTTSGERTTVTLEDPGLALRRPSASLVGCDTEGRLYLLVTKAFGDPTGRAIQVHDATGRFLREVPLGLCGGRDMGDGFPRQLVRVDGTGNIYVASATLKEGYRIEKYSWQGR